MTDHEALFVSMGEPIIGLLPTRAEEIMEASEFLPCVGGAELNVAVALARLGFCTRYVGLVGDDPLGDKVVEYMKTENVDTRDLRRASDAPTAVYFREWLHDGRRRAHYYRHASAGRHLTAQDFPLDLSPTPFALHVTGITASLGDDPRSAVEHAMRWARQRGVRVSFDPNFRPQLWPSDDASPVLRKLASSADILLMSELDAQVMFGSVEPEDVFEAAHEVGPSTVVLKQGERGAVASAAGAIARVAAAPANAVLDPVGAGDGFDGGFLAALARGASLAECLELGAFVGTRVVEVPGENGGLPRISDLPARLQGILRTDHIRRLS